jgi:hypothetical protein
MAVADAEQNRLDALLLHRLAVLERHAKPLAVERDGLVEVLDGHSYVINASEHGGVENTHMTISIEKPDFDEPREQEGFRAQRARISRQAGAERLGLSLWEVPPGQAAYPYHAHLTEEELGFLAFSPNGEPDVILQLDSGKIGAVERRPDGGGLRVWFRREDQVEYYEGESSPG